MLRDIDIFSSYLKNIHDGIIIPGHEDIDGVAARGLVNGRDPPAAGGIYRQYPHVPEIINIFRRKYAPRPVDMKNDVRRPRFPWKSAPDGILKMPTAAKMQENRGRWTLKMPSTCRDIPPKLSTCRDRCRQNILTPGIALRGEDFHWEKICCCQLPAGSDSLCRASYRYEAPPQRAMVMACDSWERVANTMPCSNGIPYIADRASETI